MKWKPHVPPKVGDIRYRRKFLIFPVLCDDGYMRGLERVWVEEKYRNYYLDYLHNRKLHQEEYFEWEAIRYMKELPQT